MWRALLKIPPGAVASYAEVARSLGALMVCKGCR
ncbi:MGMT family protein [Shewanella sp. PP-Sp27a-2]